MNDQEVQNNKIVAYDTGSRLTKNSSNADGKKSTRYIVISGSKNPRKIKFISQLKSQQYKVDMKKMMQNRIAQQQKQQLFQLRMQDATQRLPCQIQNPDCKIF